MSTQNDGYVMAQISLDLPEDILKLIGRVNVAYGHFERGFVLMLKRTSNGKISLAEAEAMVVSQSSFSDLKKTSIKQFNEWTSDRAQRRQLASLLTKAEKLTEKRHDVVHGFWYVERDTSALHWKRGDKELTVDTAQLEKLGDDIVDLARRINALTIPQTEEIHAAFSSASSTFSLPD